MIEDRNKFYCKVPGCKKVVHLKGTSRHLHSHNLTYESYSWKYHTEEIVKCPICNSEYFRTKSQQVLNTDRTCGKKECVYLLQQETTRRVVLEKYGVEHIMKVEKIKQKQQKAMLDKFGVACNFQRPEVRKNLVKKLKEIGHYKTVAKKANKTKKERGSDKISAEKQKKTKALNHRKYKEAAKKGVIVRRKSGIDIISAKKAAVTKAKNGFYDYDKAQERVRKGFETQKRNGMFGKRISNGEIAFAILLQNHFKNIVWQSKINTQDFNSIYGDLFSDFKQDLEVDFVILDYEEPIIVCFDGIFIHGLDRPITEIAEKALTSKFNANIFKKYYSDRSFEEYCQKRNINLVRFDESSFQDFLFKNDRLQPYFVCGKSDNIDNLFKALNL